MQRFQLTQWISVTHPKRQMLASYKLREFAKDNFKFDENGRTFSEPAENTVEKRRNCSLRAIFPFPTVFLRDTKKQGWFGKGLRIKSALLHQLLFTIFCGLEIGAVRHGIDPCTNLSQGYKPDFLCPRIDRSGHI